MSSSSVGRKPQPTGNEERNGNSSIAAMNLVGRASKNGGGGGGGGARK